MRPPLLGDVVAAARALRAVAGPERGVLLARLMARAAEADGHARRVGRNHPRFGDGSLMAAALAHRVVREPGLEDADYCLCLVLVLSAIAARGGSPGALFVADPDYLM
jgi:hypothetical protein